MTKLVVLPGMDGGSSLSGEFCAATRLRTCPVAYPPDHLLGYDELTRHVKDLLAEHDEPTVLVAESFSGPIAIRIAADPPPRLKALVLVATFDVAPAPRWLRALATPALFAAPPPPFVIRRLMVGAGASAARVNHVRSAIRRVAPAVLAHRLREVLDVDVRPQTQSLRLPVLYLRAVHDRLVRRPIDASTSWVTNDIEGPHLLLHMRSEACAERVSAFVAQL